MSETILEVKHLGKAFGSHDVLRDIDFSVSPKDVTCIIGPSGSGKSTWYKYYGQTCKCTGIQIKSRNGISEFQSF